MSSLIIGTNHYVNILFAGLTVNSWQNVEKGEHRSHCQQTKYSTAIPSFSLISFSVSFKQ